jgi:hypothetical protein
MKLAMKREALGKLNRLANEMIVAEPQPVPQTGVIEQFWNSFDTNEGMDFGIGSNALE